MVNSNKYEKGTIFLCKVVSLQKNFFEVVTPNQEKGIVYINEISDYYVNSLNSIVEIGNILYLTLKEINEDGLLILSFKESRSYFLRMPFKFELNNFDNDNCKFQGLYDFTNKEIKKWKKLK